MQLILRIAITMALAAAGLAALAQPFPSKSVRVIVAFPPGGGTDIVARIVGQKLSENLGQQVIIDNRGGAAGIIGTELAAKSPADGYTLFMGTMGNLAVNQTLYQKVPFDIQRDFVPVTQVVAVTFMLYTHPSFPARTVKDLIAMAKARPGEIQYGHSGNGGAPHLGGSLFESMAKVKLVSVPYKGSGPAFAELLGGHIPIAFDSGLQGLNQVKAGKLRVIAVLGAKRSSLLPDVPTVGETLPGYEVTNWFALAAPAGTPRELVNRWQSEVAKVLKLPDVRDKLVAQGADPVGSAPDEFAVFLKAETAKWARVIKEANIRAD
jgi:tripartite-type tricarboxylate transporter receptor subunit TctC